MSARSAADGGVLQVITTADRRGAEIFAVDLAEDLERRGRRVATVALGRARTSPSLDVAHLAERARTVRAVARLRRLTRGRHATIAHGSGPLPASVMALHRSGVPLVYRSIGDPRYWHRTRLRRARVDVALARADVVVCLWSGAHDALAARGVPSARLRVIPNGVRADRFPTVTPARREAARAALGLATAGPVAVYLGALSAEKRVDLAIEAIGMLPDHHLVVAGDGPQRSRLAAAAASLAPGRVRFLGSVGEPATVLAAADVVVLTSRTEGIPAALIEAGMGGVPAVATAVGGVAEVVRHGETGIVVGPDPSAAVVAEAVSAVAAGARDLGDAAARHCRASFDLAVVADAWHDLLEEL